MANNIRKVKTTSIPPYVRNLDPGRYEGKPIIQKIQPRARINNSKNKDVEKNFNKGYGNA